MLVVKPQVESYYMPSHDGPVARVMLLITQ